MTTPTDAELLPCPFCKLPATIRGDFGLEQLTCSDPTGECPGAQVGLPAHRPECRAASIAAWNRRAPQAVAGGEPVTKERYSEPLARVINAGYALSNCAFNLAQRPGTEISLGTAQTLSECSKEWDAACAAHKALPPAPPPQAVREPRVSEDQWRVLCEQTWDLLQAQDRSAAMQLLLDGFKARGITKGGQHGAE